MTSYIVVDLSQIILLLIAIIIGVLIGVVLFKGATKSEIKHLKDEINKIKAQNDKDIKSSMSLMTEPNQDGKKVLESDLKINTEQLGMQRTQVLELVRFQRNLGNQITKGKLGIDDNGSLKEHEKRDPMKELLDKYNSETLSKDEAKKLRVLLQDKQEESISADDNILAMGIGFLVAGLIAYLALKE